MVSVHLIESRNPWFPPEVWRAREVEHRAEMAKLRVLLVTYRALLEEHGIEPPDLEGADLLAMWRECRHVIEVANEFVMRLGTSKELLAEWR